MKFSCDKPLLLSAILKATRAAAVKSPVTVLEGLLLEAGSGQVRVSGYDLKTGIVTTLPADVSESGSIVLNARLFGEIVRRMPGDLVKMTVDFNFMAEISSGVSDFEILGSPPADYPELPTVDAQSSIVIGKDTLKSMISQTIFAVSDNESRPIHTGALFEVAAGVLTIVAVDGYRLALRRETLLDPKTPPSSFVVPGTALSEVEKILSGEASASITVSAKHVMFDLGDTIVISRRLEGEFLNYKNSIPQSAKYSLCADRQEFVGAVERVSLIISDKMKSPVRCVFEDRVLKIYSTSALGKASDECIITGDGENLEIGFNNKYLLDALRAAPDDEVRLELTSGITPCVIIPEDGGDSFLYMILPVRLKAYEG